MKQCAHCKEFKSLEEYAWSNKILKLRQKHCRDCMRKFNRQSYERRTPERQKQVKEDKRRRITEAKQYIWDYLSSHPCTGDGKSPCPYNENNPVVLGFDHVRGNKRANISDMAIRGHSIASIQKEISKCVVRCHNCHHKKTSKDRGWFRG